LKAFSYQQIAQWELFQKSGNFSKNIYNLLKIYIKISIQKVIGSGWVWIQKGKVCGRTLKADQVWDKPNLNDIFKSYLGYHDLEGWHNSPN
jgi:hypothetical protein